MLSLTNKLYSMSLYVLDSSFNMMNEHSSRRNLAPPKFVNKKADLDFSAGRVSLGFGLL